MRRETEVREKDEQRRKSIKEREIDGERRECERKGTAINGRGTQAKENSRPNKTKGRSEERDKGMKNRNGKAEKTGNEPR